VEARAFAPPVGARLTTDEASLASLFGEVPTAVERLALCIWTQRRIGSAHALLHLRRLAAVCLRRSVTDDTVEGTETRRVAMALAQPLKELDDALAADRLHPSGVEAATLQLSFVRFQLWRLERLLAAARCP
jgi:hypothetical protein